METKDELESIKIWKSTKEKLNSIKVHEQQSYDNLLQQLIKEHLEIDNKEKK